MPIKSKTVGKPASSQKVDQQWLTSYKGLADEVKKHGSFPTKETNYCLFRWMGTQRASYRKGTLSEHRQMLLKKINFPWSPKEISWKNQYEKVREFFEKNGKMPFWMWCYEQKERYKKGILLPYQIDLLKKIGFEFDVPATEKKWMMAYEQLREFIAVHHKAPSQVRDRFIGRWLDCQRKSYHSGTLSVGRAVLLSQLEIEWRSNDARWEKHYEAFCEHRNKKTLMSEEICQWVLFQRKQYKNGRMPQDRIIKLNSIGFQW